MKKLWQIIMTILMITAIYCTFRYKILPASAVADNTPKVVVIDPGHGGEDPGKVGIDGSLEKEINLSIARKLKELLETEGIKVYLTRESDSGLYKDSDTNKKLADMKARCKIIDECNADIVVSIHQNSYSQESVSGAQVFYYQYSEEGKKLAAMIQAELKNGLDTENTREAKSDSTYYMLLHTPCPTVIVECGFLSNSNEAALLNDEEYQEKIATAIAKGVGIYLGGK